jgi:hypothetical protein
MTRADKDALTRALDLARAESPAEARRIDTMIRERGWQSAAEFAAYGLQDRALRLRPWEVAPAWLKTDADVAHALTAPASHHARLQQAAQLVERLQAAGLSRYEPDPVRALAERAAGVPAQ